MAESDAQLILAAAAGRLEDVEELLRAGADANCRTLTGATPLYIAARQGRAEVAETLLRLRAHAGAAMQDGSAPLFIAAWHGHLATVRALLRAGAPAGQATNTGAAPLFAAAMSGHAEIVEELLRGVVRVDQATQEGVTPLMAASAAGHASVVQSLLRREADAVRRRSDGETALSVAVRGGHEVAARLLRAVLVAGGLGSVARAACARHWRPPPRPFEWPAVEAAERAALVELARAAHHWSRRSAGGEADAASSPGSSSSRRDNALGDGPTSPQVAAGTSAGIGSKDGRSPAGEGDLVAAAASAAADVATPYLGRADAFEERQPVVAYYCRVFAASLLLGAMRRGGWSQANENMLISTLEKAERAQPSLHLARGKEEMESFMLACLRRTELGAECTAAALRDVALLLDVHEWFHGALAPDWEAVADYARSRANEL